MKYEITKTRDGYESIFIHRAVVSSFRQFIDPSVGYIVILGHMLIQDIEWKNMSLPINKSLNKTTSLFRMVTYDLMMETPKFIDCINDFDDHGIDIIQMKKPMPNSLMIDRMPEIQRNSILIQNGAVMRITLPHSFETGCITAFKSNYLINCNIL